MTGGPSSGNVQRSTGRRLNGYGDGDEPLVLGGDNACLHCHLTPCIIDKPPSWLKGTAGPSLSNATKSSLQFHKGDYTGLQDHLLDTDFSYFSSVDIEFLWDYLKSIILDACHKFIPRASSSTRYPLWFTGNIRHQLNKARYLCKRGCQSDVIYLDIRKTFDSVSHTVLLTKLWQAGLCGKVDCVLKKAYNVLRMTKRLFPAATTPTVVIKLYLFPAVPILTYCSPVWRPSLVKNIVVLEQLQRRATKYILFDYQSDYKSRLSSLKLLLLSYRLEYIESVFFFVQFKHPDHSYDICNYFSFSTCSTRSSARN
uniref:Reverse transcriptase domain-containing protein n=1 Tax=Amphimedon queenslandica TaxID=400682 RepID=A0A1X7TFU4_AMPQE